MTFFHSLLLCLLQVAPSIKTERRTMLVAVEYCSPLQSFNFCSDGREMIFNSHHIIVSPDLESNDFVEFYSDTVLSFLPPAENFEHMDSVLNHLLTNDSGNTKEFRLNNLKRNVNLAYKRAGIKEYFDGKLYFAVYMMDVDFYISDGEVIEIFNPSCRRRGSIFKTIKASTGYITNVHSFKPVTSSSW